MAKRTLHAILILIAACAAFAGDGGRITGTITDPTGGVISAAVVVARNADTGLEQKTATNEAGFYAFPTLAVGRYELLVDHSGFQPYRKTGLEVNTVAAVRVDLVLALGEHSETVIVTEAIARVETTDTQMGERIAASKITGMPVNGRSYTDLLALQPGVIPASSQQPNAVVMSGCTSTPPPATSTPATCPSAGSAKPPTASSSTAARPRRISTWAPPSCPTSIRSRNSAFSPATSTPSTATSAADR